MTRGHGEDKYRRDKRPKSCVCHLNSLSSLSYCVLAVGLSAYVITTEVMRFIQYMQLPWPENAFPHTEINIHIGLVGIAAVCLPFFFWCAVLKVGNLANDGYRLGTQNGACSKDPPPIPGPGQGGPWRHAGPVAPLLHLGLAHALLMAKMVMEAAAVRENFMPQDHAWRSELSNFLPEQRRLALFWTLVNSAFTPLHGRQDSGPDFPLDSDSSSTYQYTTPDIILPDGLLTTEPSNWGPGELPNGTNGGLPIRGRDSVDLWHVGGIPWGPVSPHLVNYLIAHVVYAGRYAGVFWGTNKAFGLVLFCQLLLNAAHNLFCLNGYQVLYKVRSVSPERALVPMPDFILPVPVTVAIFMAMQVVVLASGSIIYHYGWTKFTHFIASEKEKYHIMSKHGYEVRCGYLPHSLALLWLVLMAAGAAPLLHNWMLLYRVSLDTAVLAATLACLVHILLWVLLWMALTIKSWWVFKVRVQISHATVAGPHSIRLVNEVQLTGQLEGPNSPLLVVGAGKTYLIHDQDPKRALMKTVMGAVAEKKALGQEDEIYWVLPQALQQQQQAGKSKVTFTKEAGNSTKNKSKRHSRRSDDRNVEASDSDLTNESDGDYARLRDVSFPGPSRRCVPTNVGQECSTKVRLAPAKPPLPSAIEEELPHHHRHHQQQQQQQLAHCNQQQIYRHHPTNPNQNLQQQMQQQQLLQKQNSNDRSPPVITATHPKIKVVKGDDLGTY